ncbi:hypothetical protein [Thalassospira lucentensis]|uniref:hypothetical protein n=1 Tax=Thalassospira lucentensis TaxID=168935 RepID=UPI00294299C6|nr:hypothetical protein [Thalassospira lucentensis]WOI09429.1 hypothetical protein R1T41_12895 [Thalassospira lucentensis]
MIDIIVNDIGDMSPDIFIGCIGYEDRSKYYFQNYIDPDLCNVMFYDYMSSGVLSYDANKSFMSSFDKMGIFSEIDEVFFYFKDLLNKNNNSKVVLDVTSFDREVIGRLMHLMFLERERICSVCLIYCPRKFVDIDLKFDVVQSFGPVLPIFLGDASSSRHELCLILGAGYEYGKAVGAIDTLEPDNVYCFRPTGTNPKFDEFIDKANVDFNFIDNKDHIISYDLNDVDLLYYRLRRLVEAESSRRDILILPLGPKLFAALSMIVGLILHPSVMIWRHSSCSTNHPDSITDAIATGNILKFSFSFDN